jgi:hypothetical protein
MADLTVTVLPANGVATGDLTFDTPAAGGDKFANTGREIVFVDQAGGATGDVQLEGVAGSENGRDGSSLLANAAVTVKVAGPLKPREWNSGGNVDVTYPSGVTGVTVMVVRVPLGG